MTNPHIITQECHKERLHNDYLHNLVTPHNLVKIKSDFICYYRSKSKPYCAETFKQFITDRNIEIDAPEIAWLQGWLFGVKKLG